jgi:hypothetical protein
VAMKKAHKSGEVLKIKELSLLIGCSYNSLKYHLELFEKLGLLSVVGNKLYFVSTQKLTWGKLTKRIQPKNKSVRRKLYLNFENTQVKELKKEIREFILLNSLFLQGLVQKKRHKAMPLRHAGISAKGLGAKINRSISTGQRLISRMAKENIIKVTPKFDFVRSATLEEFRSLRDGFSIPQYCIFRNNLIFKQTYSEMEILASKKIAFVKRHEYLGDICGEKIESYTIKVQSDFERLPFDLMYHYHPKDFFNRKYLKSLGMKQKQIKEVFIHEASCVYSNTAKYATQLMSFKTYNNNKTTPLEVS